jgi:sugar fermentation stimulation protein A
LKSARFIRRYQRFLVDAETENGIETIYCPNTGAMTNCCAEGWTIWYSTHHNRKRRYDKTLELVQSPDGIICVNTLRANQMVDHGLRTQKICELSNVTKLCPERITAMGTRLDFWFERVNGCQGYIEVKSVTLQEHDGFGYFPDTVSQRAQKHLQSLRELNLQGYDCYLLFCVCHEGITEVLPANHIDPGYSQLLSQIWREGVQVIAYHADLANQRLTLAAPAIVSLIG